MLYIGGNRETLRKAPRPMDHFLYRDGALHAEDVAISDIAAAVGTPFYVYSTATLERHYRLFEEALTGLPHLICFAMKANGNLAVIRHAGRAWRRHRRGLDRRIPQGEGRRRSR